MLVQVSLGDEGLTQCAAKCDEVAGACVAYVMGETGTCNLLKSISVSSSCKQQQAAAAQAALATTAADERHIPDCILALPARRRIAILCHRADLIEHEY
jgi:hypothetical protein